MVPVLESGAMIRNGQTGAAHEDGMTSPRVAIETSRSAVEALRTKSLPVQGVDDRDRIKQPDHSRSGRGRAESSPPRRRISTNSAVDSPCHGPIAAIRSPRLDWSTAP